MFMGKFNARRVPRDALRVNRLTISPEDLISFSSIMLPHGFLLIDKPAGMTSHDIVDAIRRKTSERRVGHAGTLDPFATGLLIVGVGRDSTKCLAEYVGLDKEYETEIVLGVHSGTLDPEGPLRHVPVPSDLSHEKIVEAMRGLVGDILQIPPMHSAIKIGGKKLYELARQGKEVERKPRQVRIDAFQPLEPFPPLQPSHPFTLRALVRCSSGTYIRALARDLGHALGTEAYVAALRRTAIGSYRVQNAQKL
jgi:tRNA pseudouridine55 synthase